VLPRQIAAGQSLEPRCFAVMLMCGPHGVVHKGAFNRIELMSRTVPRGGMTRRVYVWRPWQHLRSCASSYSG
jgi:hypothetical protein